MNKWPDFKNRCIMECIVNCAGVTYKPMATPLRLFGTVITNAKLLLKVIFSCNRCVLEGFNPIDKYETTLTSLRESDNAESPLKKALN